MRNSILISLIVLLFGCEKIELEKGTLVVNVTVGPLCPVEPCKKTNEELKTVYESYSLVISDATSDTFIEEKKIVFNGTKGIFETSSLDPGKYTLKVKPENIFTSRGFPRDFEIVSGQTTIIDVDIETGIR